MHNLKHFIFDFSGTLFDDQKPSFLATQETIQHFSGHSITWEEYKNDFTIPVHAFYYKYIGKNVDVFEIDQYYFKAFEKYIHEGVLFEGVRESFAEIVSQGKTISLFSTVKQNILERMVVDLKLQDFVSEIHGSVFHKIDEFKNHQSLKNKNLSEVLYVGDMDHDVFAAQQNGLVSGAVLSGYHSAYRILKARPRLVWEHPRQWLEFFKSLRQLRPAKTAKPHPVPTVGALIFNPEGECLFILTDKWSYTYGIPGGKIDLFERAEDALIREFQEETGLTITDIQFFVVQDCLHPQEFYVPDTHFLLLNYLAQTKSTDVILNDEAQSYVWLKPELALLLPLNQPTRILLEKYLKETLTTPSC